MTLVYRCAIGMGCVVPAWGLCSMNQFVSAAGGDAAKGKPIFQAKCVSCHGPESKGDGPVGKVLKPPAGNLTSAESKKKSEAELRKIIEDGKPNTAMVSWKNQLSETGIQDVLAYVLTLRK
jgi:mono/diheme cytochrome c family protein